MKRLWQWLRTCLIADADVMRVLQCVYIHGHDASPLDREKIKLLTGLSQAAVNGALGLLDYKGLVKSEFRQRPDSFFSPMVRSFDVTAVGEQTVQQLGGVI